MVGGVNFYARKEIKDLLCYLKTIDNARDDLAVRRIINIPKRGIGAATLAKVQTYANEHDISFYQALRAAEQIPSIGRAAVKIQPFVTFIQTMRSKAGILSVSELLQEIIDATGYVEELKAEGTDEAHSRIENIEELQGKVLTYEQNESEATLSGFLEEVALVADIDSLDDDQNRVILMTLHSAKGLEFPQVYLAGMEDGLFPSYMSITSDNALEEIEEERRLAYVGITRAMKNLTVTCARQRMVRGQMQYNRVSRFVNEIPKQVMEQPKKKTYRQEKENAGFSDNLAVKQAIEMFRGKTAAQQGDMQLYKNPSAQRTDTRACSADTMFDFIKAEPGKDDIHNWKAVPPHPDAQDGDELVRKRLGYGVGDLVRHQKFGDGMVVNIVSGGRDYEVTVQFHQAGVKKMFAAFAKLKKIDG